MSDAVEAELKPCPFCGGEFGKPVIDESPPGHATQWWRVRCPSCGVKTAKIVSREGAISRWDDRYPALLAAVEGSALTPRDAINRELLEALTSAAARCQLFIDTFEDVGGCATRADIGDWFDLVSKATHLDEREVTDNGWQPIETAPRDGSPVLVYSAVGTIAMARWGRRYLGADADEAWVWDGKWIPDPSHWHALPAKPGDPSKDRGEARPSPSLSGRG